jgi:hypothetical protein
MSTITKEKNMITKKILAGILGVLMLLCTFAVADYSADQPLTNVEHGMIYGDVVFVYSEEDVYEKLDSIDENTMSQDLTIDNIPEGATIVSARLYNYVTFSTAEYRDTSQPGDTAEARMTFNGAEVVCQYPEGLADPLDVSNPVDYGNGVIQYWDTKGQDYSSTSYDCPSGTFVWDVTDLIEGSDTYTATITNADRTPTTSTSKYGNESFATYGFSLLVVYDIEPEGPQPVHRYYSISEGADILKGDGWYETPENATTTAFFEGGVPMVKQADSAELTTVVISTDKVLNNVFFNDVDLGPCTQVTDKRIGVDTFDVKPYIQNHGNFAEIEDRGDYVVVSNAFLVTEYFVE